MTKAELILEHADLVEAAIQVIRSAVASGMHWDDLTALIKKLQQVGVCVPACANACVIGLC